MALSKREWIYLGGAIGAYVILTRKSSSAAGAKTASPLQRLTQAASNLLKGPASLLPTNMPRPTTTNLATGYGTRTIPAGPSALGLVNPRSGSIGLPFAGNANPLQAGIGAAVATAPASIASVLASLFSRPRIAPATSGAGTTAAKPSSAGSSGGSGTGGTIGGQGASGKPGAPSDGGMMANSPTPNGFYDADGNWVPTDTAGNILPDSSGNAPGYYTADGGYQAYLPSATSSSDTGGGGAGLQAVVPNVTPSGAVQDAMAWTDPNATQPALEVIQTPDTSAGSVTGPDDAGNYYDASGNIVMGPGADTSAPASAGDTLGDQWSTNSDTTGVDPSQTTPILDSTQTVPYDASASYDPNTYGGGGDSNQSSMDAYMSE